MTKNEAITQMELGKKITHCYFSDHEWMTMEWGKIILEDGVKCNPSMFWYDRTASSWNSGYRFFDEKDQMKYNTNLFHEWLVDDYPDNEILCFLMCVRSSSEKTHKDTIVKVFNSMPISMRWGVYCLFFDHYKIDLDDLYNIEFENYGQQTGRDGDRSYLQLKAKEKAFKMSL